MSVGLSLEFHVRIYPRHAAKFGRLRSSRTYQLPVIDMVCCEFVHCSEVVSYISCRGLLRLVHLFAAREQTGNLIVDGVKAALCSPAIGVNPASGSEFNRRGHGVECATRSCYSGCATLSLSWLARSSMALTPPLASSSMPSSIEPKERGYNKGRNNVRLDSCQLGTQQIVCVVHTSRLESSRSG